MSQNDPFAPAKQILQLANVADAASTNIFGYLTKNPNDPDAALYQRMMRDLDSAAATLETKALQIMGAVNDEALAAIKDATAKAKAFTDQTAEIKKALKVFAGVLNLAGTLISGAGPVAILTSAKALVDSAKPAADTKTASAEKDKDAKAPAEAKKT